MFVCDMGTIQSYLGIWRKRMNFGNGVVEILTKVWERKDKWCDGRRKKKIWISVISLPKFLLPNTLPTRWSAQSARKGNQLWQPSCRNCRGVRREKIRIVATKLLKTWGEFNSNLGNGVAENEGKKEEDLGQNLKEKKNCGNGIAKMGGKKKKNRNSWFVAMLLPKWKEKKSGNWFVAMELPKIGDREKEREREDKKNILDSYSKKYTYSYSFRVSVVFLIEAVWFVCMWCSFISYSKSILCMICPMKQIMNLDSKYIDSYSKKKKYIDFHNTKWKKKKKDWCAHCKQKKKRKKKKEKRNWDFCRDSL